MQLLNYKGQLELVSKKADIIFFVFFLLLGITGILLEIFSPDSPIGTLGEYLQFFLLLAAFLLAITGFRRNIRNEFFNSLFRGYVILLIFLATACVVLAIVFRGNLDGLQFLNLVIWYVVWSILIFLFPMSIVLFFIRQVKSKKYRRMGYTMAIVVFAAVFHICHYFILREIAGAMAAAAIMSM